MSIPSLDAQHALMARAAQGWTPQRAATHRSSAAMPPQGAPTALEQARGVVLGQLAAREDIDDEETPFAQPPTSGLVPRSSSLWALGWATQYRHAQLCAPVTTTGPHTFAVSSGGVFRSHLPGLAHLCVLASIGRTTRALRHARAFACVLSTQP